MKNLYPNTPRPRQKRSYVRSRRVSAYIRLRYYNPRTPMGKVFTVARKMVDREIYEEQYRRTQAGLPLYDPEEEREWDKWYPD